MIFELRRSLIGHFPRLSFFSLSGNIFVIQTLSTTLISQNHFLFSFLSANTLQSTQIVTPQETSTTFNGNSPNEGKLFLFAYTSSLDGNDNEDGLEWILLS